MILVNLLIIRYSGFIKDKFVEELQMDDGPASPEEKNK